MTPDKNFKMASSTKTMLALMSFSSSEDRHAFKRAMIQGQLAEEAARRAALKSKGNKTLNAAE